MLSRQLYENWHDEKHDDAHLQEFMKRLNLQPIDEFKTKQKEAGNFRKSLAERIQTVEKTRLDRVSSRVTTQTDKDSVHSDDDHKCPHCWYKCPEKCCKSCRKKKPNNLKRKKSTTVWNYIKISDLDTFYTLNSASVSTFHNCIAYVKLVQNALSFEIENSGTNSDWEGLSMIGSYMWLLGFCFQHIIDDGPKSEDAFEDVKTQLEEIAQTGEMMVETIEKLYHNSDRLREDAVTTVNKLIKKWKLADTSANPFLQRPERIVLKAVEPKRRVGKGQKGLEYEHELFQESIFTLNWTPQTVMLRSPKIDWTPFGTLPPFEKIHWFNAFLQECQDRLEKAAEALTHVSQQFSSIDISELNVKNAETTDTLHARELSLSLLNYAKACTAPSKSTRADDHRMTMALKDFWYSVDILNEEAYKLSHLVKETRDIIRTCYVYIDIFYKFNLPSYDYFLVKEVDLNSLVPNESTGGRKKKKKKKREGSQTMTNIKSSWSKILPDNKGGHKKLSDISEMLVMMDFSTSAYQRIVEVKPIEAGEMLMKLECHTLDHKDGLLTSGLVSGVDKRKSKLSNKY